MEAVRGGAMADAPFAWEDLAKYKAEGRFLTDIPTISERSSPRGTTFTGCWSRRWAAPSTRSWSTCSAMTTTS